MQRCAKTMVNGIECLELKNQTITCLICPILGGKLVSLKLNDQGQELLWNNPDLDLRRLPSDAIYDDNFFGGVDELLPNDEKEVVNGVAYPDHGELWTQELAYEILPDALRMTGKLAISGLLYERTLRLDGDLGNIISDYKIKNTRDSDNPFLWKMHAAMLLHEGDTLICPAAKGEIGDEDFTGRKNQRFFDWPLWNGDRLDNVAGADANKCEFFFLSELDKGEFRHESTAANTFFNYSFDKDVFPYTWYFASYGGWNGIYTGVLEPATAIPHVLSESIKNSTCSVLAAGAELSTQVIISVGRLS